MATYYGKMWTIFNIMSLSNKFANKTSFYFYFHIIGVDVDLAFKLQCVMHIMYTYYTWCALRHEVAIRYTHRVHYANHDMWYIKRMA